MSIKVTLTVEKFRRVELRVQGQVRLWCDRCGEETLFARIDTDAAGRAPMPETVHTVTDPTRGNYLCLRSIARNK
jgi:hypothetical protein